MKESFEKFSIGGLKLSQELIQIQLTPDTPLPVHEVLARLTGQHINVTMLSFDARDGRISGSFCISAADKIWTDMALLPIAGTYDMISPVGSLTIFPHQSRVTLIGSVLSAMHRIEAPIYAMASSFSALTITTDYHRLDHAAEAILSVAALPDNHAPFRPEFQVRQL
jgi:hypothetical protein